MANLSAGIAANLLMAMVAVGPALSPMPKSSQDADARPSHRRAMHDGSATQADHAGSVSKGLRGLSA